MLVIRLFALAAAAASAGVAYYEWIKLETEGVFSFRYAAMAPMGAVLALFLFIFPQYIGKPETTGQKIIVMLAFSLAVAAGLYNVYLMDPGKFGL